MKRKTPHDVEALASEKKTRDVASVQVNPSMREPVLQHLKLIQLDSRLQPLDASYPTIVFLDAGGKITPGFNLEAYTGDIGWVSLNSGVVFALIDASHLLSPDPIVAGFINFGQSTARSTKNEANNIPILELVTTLHLIAVHPVYRAIGNIGCILLQLAEANRIRLARQYQCARVIIHVNDVVFPNYSDEVYQFYYRNGYRPQAIVMGTIVMKKIINVDLTTRGTGQLSTADADLECQTRLRDFETREYPAAVTKLEELLSTGMKCRVGSRTVPVSMSTPGTLSYLRVQRSPAALRNRLRRLRVLELAAESKTVETKSEGKGGIRDTGTAGNSVTSGNSMLTPLSSLPSANHTDQAAAAAAVQQLIRQLEGELEATSTDPHRYDEEYNRLQVESERQQAECNATLARYIKSAQNWSKLRQRVRKRRP